MKRAAAANRCIRKLSAIDYVASLPPERRTVIAKLRRCIRQNLPEGFEETMSHGMLAYVVPHSRYPAGYHSDPKQPLPFINLAAQKNYVSLYHMALYGGALLAWFQTEWPRHTPARLDMGKCCIRFKDLDAIPYALVGELAAKITVAAWIASYEASVKR